MMTQKMEEALNNQINAEFYSSYLYLSMAAYFETKNLSGFANWMYVQSQEEWSHGMKFFEFLNDRGSAVKLQQINVPKTEWKGVVEVFQEVLDHEKKVTGLINDLVELSIKEKDHASRNFLQWFVDEQVEEEATASDLLEQLKLIEGSGAGLFMLDRELKQRTFVSETNN